MTDIMRESFLRARVGHVTVRRRKTEDIESLIKRFKKQVSKHGVTKEYKDHMYFEKPSDRRRRKKAQSIRNIKREEKKAEEREERFRKIKLKRRKKERKRHERFNDASSKR